MNSIQLYNDTYRSLCDRLKMMVVNGQRMSDEEVKALATFATHENLDPFTGECYMMKDYNKGTLIGPAVGIRGLRRKAKEELERQSPGATYFTNFVYENPQDATILWQVRCELRDTASMQIYVKARREAVEMFNTAASPTSLADSEALVGPPPLWYGIGYFLKSESSDYKDRKYNPRAKAEKRAEAEALKKRFSFNYDYAEAEDLQPQVQVQPTVTVLDEPPQFSDPVVAWIAEDQVQATITQTGETKGYRSDTVTAIIGDGMCQSIDQAMRLLKFSGLPETVKPEAAATWTRTYRAWRDLGKDTDECKALAYKGEMPKRSVAKTAPAEPPAGQVTLFPG